MSDVVDLNKRRFLQKAAALAGVVGVAGFVTPFIASMLPSKKSLEMGGPVRFQVADLSPGKLHQVLWQGKPVTILHRTQAQMDALMMEENTRDLADPFSKQSKQPDYVDPQVRSRSGKYEPYFVVLSICTHLNCIPNLNQGERTEYFLCPCHQSEFDLAGRVRKGSPANANLEIPPFCFDGDELVVGLDQI